MNSQPVYLKAGQVGPCACLNQYIEKKTCIFVLSKYFNQPHNFKVPNYFGNLHRVCFFLLLKCVNTYVLTRHAPNCVKLKSTETIVE